MKRYSTRNEAPRPFEAQAEPDALPLPHGPDSRMFRLLLNGSDPYIQGVAELVGRLWLKQRPREDAEAILAQVLEDLAEGRYALRHLAAYLNALPLVASPCHRLAEMIAEFVSWRDIDAPADAGSTADAAARIPTSSASGPRPRPATARRRSAKGIA